MEKIPSMRQATQADIKVGNYVLLKYTQENPGYSVPVDGGHVQKKIIEYSSNIYIWSMIEIKSVKDGFIDLTGYSTTKPEQFMLVDDEKAIHEFETYHEFWEEAKTKIKYPTGKYYPASPGGSAGLFVSADMEVEWHYKLDDYARKKFVAWVSAPDIEGACDQILELVKANEETLCEQGNLPLLAYIMFRWYNLYYAGRYIYGEPEFRYQCQNNPKYEIEDLSDDEERMDVIYDAWCASLDMDEIIPKEFTKYYGRVKSHDSYMFNEADFAELSKYYDRNSHLDTLLNKQNKTMGEWCELLMHPDYRYKSMFGSRMSVLDYLLCTLGTSYGWNKSGYISKLGPAESDGGYGKYLFMKGRSGSDIEKSLDLILSQRHVQDCMDMARMKFLDKYKVDNRKQVLKNAGIAHVVIDVIADEKIEEKVPEFLKTAVKMCVTEKFNEEVTEIRTLMKELKVRNENLKKETEGNADLTTIKYGKIMIAECEEKISKKFTKLTSEITKSVTASLMSSITGSEIDALQAYHDAQMEEFISSRNSDADDTAKVAHRYYPISKGCPIAKIPANAHESYVDAAIELCKDIIESGRDSTDEQVMDNVEFAMRFLISKGFKEYEGLVAPAVDKIAKLAEVEDLMSGIRTLYPKSEDLNIYNMQVDTSCLWLNNSDTNDYADDNIQGIIKFNPDAMPKGISNDMKFLKGTPVYEHIKLFVESVKGSADVYGMTCEYENFDKVGASIKFKVYINGKQYFFLDNQRSDAEFVEQGFLVGDTNMALVLDDVILVTPKSKTLGSRHPNNTDGRQYFSNAQYFNLYDLNWNKVLGYTIDERGFNTLTGGIECELNDWVKSQYAAMQASDPSYSKNNGRHLYSHDFMLWLRSHQPIKAI